MKIFAVLDKYYDYNDEYYYQKGNGDVLGLFPNEVQAKEFMDKKGVELFRKNPDMYLGEEGYDFLEEQNGHELLRSMNDEEIVALMVKNSVEIFEVQPIEVTADFIKQLGK